MRLGILVIALTLTACDWERKGEMTDAEIPPGWKQFITPGANITYVIPVEFDGVKCVVVSGNGGNSGRGITCDWGKHD
jgi:hypothetical protein